MALDYLQSRLVRRKLVAEMEKESHAFSTTQNDKPSGAGEKNAAHLAPQIRNYEAEIQQVQIGPNSIGGGLLPPP